MIALSVHVFESVHPFLWAVDSPICRSSLMLGTGRGGGLRCFCMSNSPDAERVDEDFGKVQTK